MKKLQIALIVIFVFLLVFVSFSISQSQDIKKLKAGMPNTVTLSNGDVVYDLNGEWDAQIENYGRWEGYGKYSNILKITLEGNSFVGIRMKSDTYHASGTEAIRGELDKDGIKKVQIMSGMGPLDAKGQISEDGNKIIIDDGEKARLTLIRK